MIIALFFPATAGAALACTPSFRNGCRTGGTERRLGPGDAGAGQTNRALPWGDRDVQCLGVPAGDRRRLAIRGHPTTLWFRTEYRNPRWTGRLGDRRVSPQPRELSLGPFPHAVAPNLDCCSARRDRGCYAGGRMAV